LSKTVRPSIFVGLSNDPSRSIRYTKVQDLSRPHNVIQGEHNLLDGRRVIPPMDIEDINVIGLQLEQGGFKRVLEGFLVVPSVVYLDTGEFAFLGVDVWGGVLTDDQSYVPSSKGYIRGENDLISDLSLGHPVTDDDLRLLVCQSACVLITAQRNHLGSCWRYR
jgi:hypothetical protein